MNQFRGNVVGSMLLFVFDHTLCFIRSNFTWFYCVVVTYSQYTRSATLTFTTTCKITNVARNSFQLSTVNLRNKSLVAELLVRDRACIFLLKSFSAILTLIPHQIMAVFKSYITAAVNDMVNYNPNRA